jgi:hypothetical protein
MSRWTSLSSEGATNQTLDDVYGSAGVQVGLVLGCLTNEAFLISP